MRPEPSVTDILAAVYAAPLKPELWNVALERLSAAVGISQAGLIEHRRAENRHKIFAFVGDQLKDGGPLYEKHYWAFDEWTMRFPKQRPPRGLVRGEEIWPETAMRRCARAPSSMNSW